jgi:hypothetical protein
VEVQPVPSFVSHRKIWKDEVTRLRGTVEVRDASDWHTGQDRARWRSRHSAVSDRACRIQGCVKEEVGIVGKRDIGLVGFVIGIGLEDTQLDDGRRINRATVGRC